MWLILGRRGWLSEWRWEGEGWLRWVGRGWAGRGWAG